MPLAAHDDMTARLEAAQLDEILALQVSVAWAGEGAGDPPRLGWWGSDLVDPEGGGDLLARLVPKTAAWAGLSLVRQAACRVDEAARQKLAAGDRVWTLFHFGFAVDEQLDDRLAFHRQARRLPAEVLGDRFFVGAPFSPDALKSKLHALAKPKVQVEPGGRKVSSKAASPIEAARLLAAALLPLADEYPLPFMESSA